MRKIIFRGKRIDNSKWVYGDLLHSDDCGLYICPEFGHVRGPFKKVEFPFMGNVCVYEVDPKTVGQYIGFEDNVREKIFEGDIIKVFERRYCIDDIRRVHLFINCINKAKVIGNIHDNPELLVTR